MKAANLRPFYHKTFRIEELQNYFQEPITSIRTQLSRLCKSKKLLRLKRNFYTFPDFHPNVFIIGQNMVDPSYYSLESVLSWNGIIPEGVTVFTLITSKKTQQYVNAFGTFSYRHLPPALFFGVEQRTDGAWIAKPEKALLDYLYLNSSKLAPTFDCWKAERVDELDKLDFTLMKKWAPAYGSAKLPQLVMSLEQYTKSGEYQAHR